MFPLGLRFILNYWEFWIIDVWIIKFLLYYLELWYIWRQPVNAHLSQPLRKHAYSNIQKILAPKYEKIQIKNCDIFHISAQNIDCGYSLEPPRRGGSNEYPQSMFSSRNKKNNVYPRKPQFYNIKVGVEGGAKLYVFMMTCEKGITT